MTEQKITFERVLSQSVTHCMHYQLSKVAPDEEVKVVVLDCGHSGVTCCVENMEDEIYEMLAEEWQPWPS